MSRCGGGGSSTSGCAPCHRVSRVWCYSALPTRDRAKNTLHLDLHVPSVADLPAAVDRAVSLGATVVAEHDLPEATWRTLADPEGNVFCLVAD